MWFILVKKKRDKYRIFERACTINRTTCIGMKRCEREKGREREERREFNKWKTEKASELWEMYSSTKEGYRVVPFTWLHSTAGVAPDTLILESASFASWTSDHVSRITDRNQIRIKIKHHRISEERLSRLTRTYLFVFINRNFIFVLIFA